MIDFHSHILHQIDDGSRSIEQSVQMLKLTAESDVDKIIATPHFYATRQDPEAFITKRKERYSELLDAVRDSDGLPEIGLGAEVAYFEGISDCDYLSEFKIQNTNLILLEMPMNEWNERIIREVSSIYEKHQIVPVIAHIDRYMKIMRRKNIVECFDGCPVFIQANASFFADFFSRRTALKMLSDGRIHLLGSDCHNTDSRRPNLGAALEIIRRRLGTTATDRIEEFSSLADSGGSRITEVHFR